MKKEQTPIVKSIILFSFIFIVFVIYQGIRITGIDYVQTSELDYNILRPLFALVVAAPFITMVFIVVPTWFIFEFKFWINISKIKIDLSSLNKVFREYNYKIINRYSRSKLQVVRC